VGGDRQARLGRRQARGAGLEGVGEVQGWEC
jgi:hypothetical protein